VVIVIIEYRRAFIECRPSDGDALVDVLLSLENVVCELVDLTKELNLYGR